MVSSSRDARPAAASPDPGGEFFPPVDAFPQPMWHSPSPGHWSATRGIIGVGSVRESVTGFTARDAAGYDLGIYPSFSLAQAAIVHPYTRRNTGAAPWAAENRLVAFGGIFEPGGAP